MELQSIVGVIAPHSMLVPHACFGRAPADVDGGAAVPVALGVGAGSDGFAGALGVVFTGPTGGAALGFPVPIISAEQDIFALSTAFAGSAGFAVPIISAEHAIFPVSAGVGAAVAPGSAAMGTEECIE